MPSQELNLAMRLVEALNGVAAHLSPHWRCAELHDGSELSSDLLGHVLQTVVMRITTNDQLLSHLKLIFKKFRLAKALQEEVYQALSMALTEFQFAEKSLTENLGMECKPVKKANQLLPDFVLTKIREPGTKYVIRIDTSTELPTRAKLALVCAASNVRAALWASDDDVNQSDSGTTSAKEVNQQADAIGEGKFSIQSAGNDDTDGVILRVLANSRRSLKIVDVAVGANRSERTCGERLPALEAAGLVERLKGKNGKPGRRGVKITAAGEAHFDKIKHTLPFAD